MVSLSQQGAEGMKQFLELSSFGAISSTQSQPHPGATLLGEHPLPPWGAQTSTDPIPLQSPYPAVYVHVPCLLPTLSPRTCSASPCVLGNHHGTIPLRDKVTGKQHKVKGVIRRNPSVPSRSPPQPVGAPGSSQHLDSGGRRISHC